MVFITSLLGWIGIAQPVEAGCAAPVAPDGWADELGRAETAFAALDAPGFEEQLARATRDLACLALPVAPPLAARYHRLVGLDHFIHRDEEGARLAFAAARAVDPLGVLPADLLPQGHVARALSESASTPGATTDLWPCHDTVLWFDGIPSTRRPADRDTFLQVEVGGAVIASRYLTPADPLPRGIRTRSAHRALLWAASGAGVALGGAAIGAAVILK